MIPIILAVALVSSGPSDSEIARLVVAIESYTAQRKDLAERGIAGIEESGREPFKGARGRFEETLGYIKEGGYFFPLLDLFAEEDAIGRYLGAYEIQSREDDEAVVDLTGTLVGVGSPSKPEATFKRIVLRGLAEGYKAAALPPLRRVDGAYEAVDIETLRKRLPAKVRELR